MTKSIVLEVCAELDIPPHEFFGPMRDRRLTNSRRVAVERLHEAGFSYKAAARLIKRNYSTVQYWLKPEYRASRVEYYRRYHAAKRVAA
jgi:IS30 family transposase